MADDGGWLQIARLDDLPEGRPAAARAEGVELVLVRKAGRVFVLCGRCPHRAALLAAHGAVDGERLVCGRHGWDFLLDGGGPPQGDGEGLAAFAVELGKGGEVRVQRAALRAHAARSPAVFHDDEQVA